jgi:hypothetical protein
VAADRRVYFRGKIWDGQTWHNAPVGPRLTRVGSCSCSVRSAVPFPSLTAWTASRRSRWARSRSA